MRIGLFTDCYYPQINGVVTSVKMLRDELIKQGHQVYVITVKVPDYKVKESSVIRVNSIPFAKWKEFRIALPFIISMYYKIRKLKLDIIHTHTEFSIGILGRFLSWSLQIPMVHTYHTMYEDYTHYVAKVKQLDGIIRKIIIKTSKIYMRPATAIIAPTQKTKDALIRYGVKVPVHILPTGIDLNQFGNPSRDQASEIKSELKITDQTPVILSLGRLSQEKSVDVIVKEMPNILGKFPLTQLVIVGDGPYKHELEKIAEDLQISNNVKFVGRVPFEEVASYYAISSVFATASKSETQGLTIMEAMGSKIPVVCFDDENITGVVSHNVSGMLFNSPDKFSECVIDLLSNPAKCKEISNNALKVVKSLSKEEYAKKAIEIYRELISDHMDHNKRKIFTKVDKNEINFTELDLK